MLQQEFIAKNGYIETHGVMMETAATDAAITEAEAEFQRNGQLHDAREALASLRRKHFG